MPELPFTVITIAGTNGKGSSVAMLEAILSEAGYRVGSYTSPHLTHYNERIKINRKPVSDQSLCQAFEKIDNARDKTSLTYFEFGTLAAVEIFYSFQCEIVILEVGLGGRLDAVNVIDPDVALITTVDIDHQEWLGKDRNTIALEKAGIYRNTRPAIYGDVNLPDSIQDKVMQECLEFYQFGKNYNVQLRAKQFIGELPGVAQWNWLASDNLTDFRTLYNLPLPQMKGEIQLKNAANVIMVLQLLKELHPVSLAEIKRGLLSAKLPGRFQIISVRPLIILDVAHNVQAAESLKHSIEQLDVPGKVHVIVGMLKDKDVKEVLSVMAPVINSWRIIELDSPRAMPAGEIETILREQQDNEVKSFSDFAQAYQDFARYNGGAMETLLVFGSFFTVSDALRSLNSENKN